MPHYIRAERPLFGWCGTSPVSSATCIRLTSFPMLSPKSIDAGCGGSRVGTHFCSTTWGTPGAYKGFGRRYTGVCVELTPGSPLSRGVSRCRSARPRYRYLHNSCCISGGDFLALICRGARTCVSVFYPHGQSVMCRCIINYDGRAIILIKQINALAIAAPLCRHILYRLGAPIVHCLLIRGLFTAPY